MRTVSPTGRYAQVDVIKDETIATLVAEDETLDANELSEILHAIEKTLFVAAYWLASRVSMAVKRHDPWSGRAYWRTATYSRFCAVHPWRNAGAGYRDRVLHVTHRSSTS